MRRAAMIVGLCGLAGCKPGGEPTAAPEPMRVRIEQPAAVSSHAGPDAVGGDPASAPSALGVLKPPVERPDCQLQLTLGLEDSVLAEHHERNGWEDFHLRFPAYPIDRATFEPVQATADFAIETQPVFWFTPNGGRVVVDHTFSSDLEAVDAFSIPVGASAPVGSLERAGLGLSPQRWVELLLRARVVATWAEGSAELCIEWREAEGDAFDAYVQGVRAGANGAPQPMHFLVRIDTDRTISVVGLPR